MKSNIKKVMQKFNFEEKSASLLYWKNTEVGNRWSLKVAGHLSNREERGLKDYVDSRIACGDVGPNTWGHHDCFAGLAAQTRVTHQRTDNPYQFLGHLVMPVFRYAGTQEILVGVIELVTYIPKDSYIEEFNQINMLLKGEKLATAKKIKIDYGGNTVWFSLPLESGTTYLWKNVTERFNTLNQRAFRIMYSDYYGYPRTISTDADLRACLVDPGSMGSLKIRMFIVRIA
ncbi:PB1 domain-containing protein [Artemisia annua]|uniref:PB1 domain-containing protein n=1 Tax=Artemisia annua TaxID=35608 RepID=A0A2U1MWS2_ARTAN|nr:PB1 domain-containing protein [Artemisia annua]PWA97423.1 PB1 domain-containing protein [Artemisia annua]